MYKVDIYDNYGYNDAYPVNKITGAVNYPSNGLIKSIANCRIEFDDNKLFATIVMDTDTAKIARRIVINDQDHYKVDSLIYSDSNVVSTIKVLFQKDMIFEVSQNNNKLFIDNATLKSYLKINTSLNSNIFKPDRLTQTEIYPYQPDRVFLLCRSTTGYATWFNTEIAYYTINGREICTFFTLDVSKDGFLGNDDSQWLNSIITRLNNANKGYVIKEDGKPDVNIEGDNIPAIEVIGVIPYVSQMVGRDYIGNLDVTPIKVSGFTHPDTGSFNGFTGNIVNSFKDTIPINVISGKYGVFIYINGKQVFVNANEVISHLRLTLSVVGTVVTMSLFSDVNVEPITTIDVNNALNFLGLSIESIININNAQTNLTMQNEQLDLQNKWNNINSVMNIGKSLIGMATGGSILGGLTSIGGEVSNIVENAQKYEQQKDIAKRKVDLQIANIQASRKPVNSALFNQRPVYSFITTFDATFVTDLVGQYYSFYGMELGAMYTFKSIVLEALENTTITAKITASSDYNVHEINIANAQMTNFRVIQV